MDKTQPTRPPSSGNTEPMRFRPGRSLLAILAGVLSDLGGTNVVVGCYSLIIVMPMIQSLAAQGLSQTEMQAQIAQSLQKATSGSILVNVLGILLSITGGWVAGRIARYAEVIHGLAVGLGVTLVSVTLTLILRLPTGGSPPWQLLLVLVINWGATTAGGYLAQLQRMRSRRKTVAE